MSTTTASQEQTEYSGRSSSVSAFLLQPKKLDIAGWRNFNSLLDPAVALQNEFSTQDLAGFVARGEAQLWAMVDDDTGIPVGALVTQISTFPSGLRACIILAAGSKDTQVKWDSMRSVLKTIENFAIDNSCDVVRVPGRKGWARVFHDYETAYVVLEKRLGEVH